MPLSVGDIRFALLSGFAALPGTCVALRTTHGGHGARKATDHTFSMMVLIDETQGMLILAVRMARAMLQSGKDDPFADLLCRRNRRLWLGLGGRARDTRRRRRRLLGFLEGRRSLILTAGVLLACSWRRVQPRVAQGGARRARDRLGLDWQRVGCHLALCACITCNGASSTRIMLCSTYPMHTTTSTFMQLPYAV